MAKKAMDDLLKRRMCATQQASELQVTDEAYAKLFQKAPPAVNAQICNLPLDKLTPFFTADIGFRPYTPSQLQALAGQLAEDGLMVRIIVRPIPGEERYEILAGHNRTAAARLAGWSEIPAEVVEADDARAVVIATSTNLIHRQNLSIIVRGKAYKALLDAKNRHGQWYVNGDKTFGENRQKLGEAAPLKSDGSQRYNARALVAEFFGVTEYEIRKAVKLTYLIPELASILETAPKQLNLACADMIADYDPESQQAFIEMCRNESYPLNKAAMKYIASKCPPPSAKRQDMYEAWREARARAEKRLAAPPKKISLDRKQFAPYLDGRSDKEIVALFLEFLRERMR